MPREGGRGGGYIITYNCTHESQAAYSISIVICSVSNSCYGGGSISFGVNEMFSEWRGSFLNPNSCEIIGHLVPHVFCRVPR